MKDFISYRKHKLYSQLCNLEIEFGNLQFPYYEVPNQLPARFEVAEDDEGQLSACLIDIDDKTGKAKSIQPIRITPDAPFFE